MLKCPGTLENSPLLEFALKRLASGRWLDRIIFCALWPVGKAQTTVLELQDHFAAFNYIRHKIRSAAPFHPGIFDWSKLIASADESKITDTDMVTNASSPSGDKTIDRRDATFRDRHECVHGLDRFGIALAHPRNGSRLATVCLYANRRRSLRSERGVAFGSRRLLRKASRPGTRIPFSD